MHHSHRWTVAVVVVAVLILLAVLLGILNLGRAHDAALVQLNHMTEELVAQASARQAARRERLASNSVTAHPHVELPPGTLEEQYVALLDDYSVRFGSRAHMAFKEIADGKHHTGWTSEQMQECVALMNGNAAFVGQVRGLAAQDGHPLPWDFEIRYPHLNRHWNSGSILARLLRADVVTAVAEGDRERAFEDVMALLQMGDTFAAECGFRGYRVMLESYELAFEALSNDLPPGFLRTKEIDAILAHLHEAHHREAFAASVACSLRGWIEMHERVDVRLFAKVNVTLAARYATEALSLAQKPFHEAQGDLDTLTQRVGGLPSFCETVRRMMEMHLELFDSQALHETRIELMCLGLLAEEHKRQHGKYPESLEVLAADFGGTVPVDPVSGEPYRYRVTKDGFLLYGVGENRRDDGGRPDSREGDIVWRGRQREQQPAR